MYGVSLTDWKEPAALAKVADNTLLNTRQKFLRAYGEEFGALVANKADAPLETGTANNLYQMVGVKLWMQLNTEENLVAIFKMEAWGTNADGYDGWRVVTAYPTTKGYMMGEKDSLPDDGIFGFDILFDKPKTADTKFSNTELAFKEAMRGQAIVWSQYVRMHGLAHKLFLCEQFALEVGDNNATTGINPVDQIISSYSECANCATITAKTTAASQFYQATVDRSAAASAMDAYVAHNSETLRPFNLNLVDDFVAGLREQCGIYSTDGYVFVTGIDTQKRWKQLARPYMRFTMGRYETSVKGGLRSVAGSSFGFNINEYDGIPIIVSRHITDALRPTLGLTPIYLIHLPDITIWVDHPTTYTERGFTQGEDILMGAHKVVGLYHTMLNIHAYRFFTHGKLRDIAEV